MTSLSRTPLSFFFLLLAGCSRPVFEPNLSPTEVSSSTPTNLDEWPLVIEGNSSQPIPNFLPPRSLGGGNPQPPELRAWFRTNPYWVVTLQIYIGANGKAVKAKCISESTKEGDKYAEWAASWNYIPAKSSGKNIQCIWQIQIPKIKSTSRITIQRY